MLKVDTVCMETQAQQMQIIATQLNDISSRVAAVNQKLRWNTNIAAIVRLSLTACSTSISKLDDKSERLAQALISAADQYTQGENNASSVTSVTGSVAGQGNGGGGSSALGDEGNLGGLFAVTTESSWLGYEYNEDYLGGSAWVGKAGAEYSDESLSAEVNGEIGKIDAEVDGDFSLFQTKTEKKHENGKWVEDEKTTILNAEATVGASVSILAGDAAVESGDDMLGAGIKGEAAAGTAKAEVKGQFFVGEKGINAYAKGEALVTAVEGKASGTVNILGLKISVKASGYAGGLGVESGFGMKDGSFVMEVGGAALIGGAVGIEIGVNETGWNNFVDFITFWD